MGSGGKCKTDFFHFLSRCPVVGSEPFEKLEKGIKDSAGTPQEGREEATGLSALYRNRKDISRTQYILSAVGN